MNNGFLRQVLLIVMLIVFTEILFAQKADSVVFRKNAVYLELLGNGGGYSFNIERSFLQHNNGFFTIRIGLYYNGQSKYPILINHVFGNGNSHFEMGGGVRLPIRNDYDEGIATANFMYRYQKPGGDLLFRIGWTPIFNKLNSSEVLLNFWCGASIGLLF